MVGHTTITNEMTTTKMMTIVQMMMMCRRRGLMEKAEALERRKQAAETELEYQMNQRRYQKQQQQQQAVSPAGGGDVYEQIDLEENGYAIPDFVKSDSDDKNAIRSGYEQLPSAARVPAPPPPRENSHAAERAQVTDPAYSTTLPHVPSDYVTLY